MKIITKQHSYTVLLVFIIMLPNILLICIGEDSITISTIKKLVFFAFSLAYVVIPLAFFRPKVYAFLSILLTGFLVFELYNIINYKVPSTEEMLAVVFLTNYRETIEFAGANIVYLVGFTVIIIAQIIAFIKIKRSFILQKKTRILLFTFSFSIFAILLIRDYLFVIKKDNSTSFKINISKAFDHYEHKVEKIFPIEYYYKIKYVRDGFKKVRNYSKRISDFSFNAVKKDTTLYPEIYVLVIGESARRANFKLFGYSKNTNPRLSKNNRLIAFTNTKSAANMTSISIPFIVTRATPKKNHIGLEEASVIKAFEEASFKTYWLTNQPSGPNSIYGLYASFANQFKSLATSFDVINYDERLLSELSKVLADDTSDKKFIVIHTLGSHFRYGFRYPDKFKKYKPVASEKLSIGVINNVSYKEEFINAYDNSILYTDYILDSIIKKVEQTKASSYMYYISDHGENLFDDEREYLLHGLSKPTKFEINIPLLLWRSKEYDSLYKDKVRYLLKHKNNRISTVNTFHTLLDMANISYKDENLKKSFANKEFDTLQTRFLLRTNKEILQLDK